jgi:hypothetical protein
MSSAAIGLRVKSGWASTVLLVDSIRGVQVEDRRVIELSDPRVPESRQPFHPAMGLPEEAAESVVARLRKAVERRTNRSVAALIGDYRTSGHDLVGVGLVVGSDIDPSRITSPHVRAHALEGRLFREILEHSVQSHGLRCLVVVERHAYAEASRALGHPEDELRRTVVHLGRALQGPWRSEEKTATLAAWLVLASRTDR